MIRNEPFSSLRLLASTESVSFDDFSDPTREKLEKISKDAVGVVNVVFDDDVSRVDVLGFVGRQRVQVSNLSNFLSSSLTLTQNKLDCFSLYSSLLRLI